MEKVAILDCSKIASIPYSLALKKSEEFQEFTKQLGNGMSGIGFVYLINHGVDNAVAENVFEETKKFFELPSETKMRYKKVDPVNNFSGFTPSTGEEIANENEKSSRDFKESFNFTGRDIMRESFYPKEIPQLCKSIQNVNLEMKELSKKVMLALALYLKLDDPEYFVKRHTSLDDLLNPMIDPWIDIRANYYLPISDEDLSTLPENALRLTEHNDWGTVTFLMQDMAGGLEAKNTNGEWISVPPIKNSIVLNAGLMLEMWSAGWFPATGHRVILIKEKAKEVRQSLAWFLLPDGETRVSRLVEKKQGWEWTPLYPEPTLNQSSSEYFKERISRLYVSRY